MSNDVNKCDVCGAPAMPGSNHCAQHVVTTGSKRVIVPARVSCDYYSIVTEKDGTVRKVRAL